MTRRSPVRKVVVGAGIGVVVVAWMLGSQLSAWVFARGAARAAATDQSDLLADDALRIAVCGSSAPLPSADRAKSCVAIFAGGSFYLVDVGPESVEHLVTWGIPLARIKGVLLTHFHSDHIGDLGELNLQTWAQGRPTRLDVYGGPGVDQVVNGFNQAYRLDQGYRTAHHSERLLPVDTWPLVAHAITLGPAPAPEQIRTAIVLEDGELRITAIEVNHTPVTPAYAYRFDYQGRSVVVSGDLKFDGRLAKALRGTDILVMEAIARPMVEALETGARAAGRERQATILHDIQDYHVDPAETARLANAAEAQFLLLTHLLPAPDTALARGLFARDLEAVRRGGWALADDGTLGTLPIGSREVRMGLVTK